MLPVAERVAAQNRRCELADIFRNYGQEYRQNHALPLSHLRVMRAVERCRTAALGGHLQQCDACGFERPAYNWKSCRWDTFIWSSLCPMSSTGLSSSIRNPLINILFHAVSETLLEFARTHLGGTLGLTAVLHTWDQILLDHFHLHCLVPVGALSGDQNRWISAGKNFLFPVKALSIVFRSKFLEFLKKAFDQKKLLFVGQSAPLADGGTFTLLLKILRQKPWVVYAKKPFASPDSVLDYLGRYTHRVALSNNRICSLHNSEVTFTYRDRKNQNQLKLMKLQVYEFIRRFLLHVIPKGFMRVRHFGFLANRSKERLSTCRQLLGLLPALPKPLQRSTHELMLALTGIDLTRCPRCRKGTLIWRAQLPIPPPQDSS